MMVLLKILKYRFNYTVRKIFLHWMNPNKSKNPNTIYIGNRRGPPDAIKRIKLRWFDTKKWRTKKRLEKERRDHNRKISQTLKKPEK